MDTSVDGTQLKISKQDEHEKSTPPQPRDEDIAAKLSVTWGLYCQVHRLARASMLLAHNGMGQERIVLNRVMLEHTIVLHWVIARGDDGTEAVRANQSKQMRKWLGKTRNTTLEVPPEIAGEITSTRHSSRAAPTPTRTPALSGSRPPATPQASPSPQRQSRGSHRGQRRTAGFDD